MIKALIISIGLLSVQIETYTKFILKGQINEEYFLGIPLFIDSFDDGSFILSQHREYNILHLDKDGNFIKSVGKRGDGPGEFRDINFVNTNSQNQIMVTDRRLFKVTVFDTDGSFSDHVTFRFEPNIRNIHQLGDNKFLIALRKSHLRNTEEGQNLYYVMDSDFRVHDNGFVKINDLHTEGPGSLPAQVMSGSQRLTDKSVLTKNEDLVIAPALYNGELLIYESYSGYKEFRKLITENYGSPYVEIPSSKKITGGLILSELLTTRSGPGFRRIFHHLNRSHGIFRTSSGKIIHFVEAWIEDKPELLIEILNEDASTVLHTQRLENIGDILVEDLIQFGRTYGIIRFNILHMDQNDNIYVFREGENYEPELHVIRIDINISE